MYTCTVEENEGSHATHTQCKCTRGDLSIKDWQVLILSDFAIADFSPSPSSDWTVPVPVVVLWLSGSVYCYDENALKFSRKPAVGKSRCLGVSRYLTTQAEHRAGHTHVRLSTSLPLLKLHLES